MDPSLKQLARTARTKTLAALRVVLCAVVLLSVQGSVVHTQRATVPTRLDVDTQTETVAVPATQGPSLRLRAALPGGDGPGKPVTLPTLIVWTCPERADTAEFAQVSQRIHEACAVLQPGRGPPTA